MTSVAPAPPPTSPSSPPAASGSASLDKSSNKTNKTNNSNDRLNKQQPRYSADDELLASITAKQSALLQPTITLTLYIPTSSVGAVIGRRGQTIAQLQKFAAQAGSTHQPVRVSVVGQQPDANDNTMPYTYSDLDFSDPNWTPVVIRADPKAAFTAAQKLLELAPLIDEAVVDIPLSRTKHSAIVGKRGMTLASLSADTSVRIMVPNKELRHDVIQLEGDLPNIKQCLDRILSVAIKATKVTTNKQEDLLVTQLPSQTKLRNVSRKTDTSIKKKKVEEGWQLTIAGTSTDSIQAAIAMLQSKRDEAPVVTVESTSPSSATGHTPAAAPSSPQQARARGGRGKRNKGSPKRKPPNKSTDTTTATST